MEKHIQIFCDQNPNTEIECPVCHQIIKIKTTDFLKHPNLFQGTCEKCGNEFAYNTTKLFKELEWLKKFC